jgi:hypothetical protein
MLFLCADREFESHLLDLGVSVHMNMERLRI